VQASGTGFALFVSQSYFFPFTRWQQEDRYKDLQDYYYFFFNTASREFSAVFLSERMPLAAPAHTQPATNKPTSSKLIESTGRGAWNLPSLQQCGEPTGLRGGAPPSEG